MKNKVPKLRFPEFSGEWEEKTIGSFMECIVPGRNKPQEFLGDIPWITTPDISGKNFVYSSKNKLSISKAEIKKIGAKIVPENSIIMSCVGDLGVICIAGTDIVINQQLHAFLPNSEINNIFVKNSLLTKISYMEKIATKTAVLYMNKDACNSIPILLPSLPEQEKIASFLSKVDESIEILEEEKELWEKYKKGMMQKIFSQKLKFKDENGNNYPEWEEKKLGEIADIRTGNKDLINKVDDGQYPFFVRSKNIEKIDSYSFDGEAILIPGDGQIGQIYHYINGKFDYHQRVYKISDFISGKGKYIYYYLQENFMKHALQNTSKATVDSLRLPIIKDFLIFVPSLPEQQKIANFLSSIDEKIELIEKELEGVKEFKKGLLQQMFV